MTWLTEQLAEGEFPKYLGKRFRRPSGRPGNCDVGSAVDRAAKESRIDERILVMVVV